MLPPTAAPMSKWSTTPARCRTGRWSITDYFLRGKSPIRGVPAAPGTATCWRPWRVVWEDGTKPVAASEMGVPTQSAPGVAAQAPAEAEAPRRPTPTSAGVEPTKKKRGFWSRVFGKDKPRPAPPPGRPAQVAATDNACYDLRDLLPCRSVRVHRPPHDAAAAVACGRRRHAAAQPDLCGPRRCRQARGRGGAGPGDQLPDAGRAQRRHLPLDACGECPVVPAHRRGLHPDVIVVEPGDTGTIKIEAVRDEIAQAGVPAVRGAPPRGHLQRSREPRRCRAERAAEDARGAAARVGVRFS